jgi:aminopeptidase-like protein
MHPRLHACDPAILARAWPLLGELYALGGTRSLLGEAYRRSLEAIDRLLPLEWLRIPSGSVCGSWTIPPAWSLNRAYVVDPLGRRHLDTAIEPLHLWQYSEPFQGRLSREELLRHLHCSETAPDAVPLAVTFYKRRWGFCASRSEIEALPPGDYEVLVDTAFHDDELLIGECVLPGKQSDEILVDAVLSCPALANNCSGPVLATCLGALVAALPERRWTWRFTFTPETIGPIAAWHHFPGRFAAVRGGWTLSNLADPAGFTYRRSRPGDSLADRAILHSLRHAESDFDDQAYDVRTGTCGNEKAWNSLGIEVPVGALRRSPFGSYAAYDTNADDLTFVGREALEASLRLLWGAVQTLERCDRPRHCFVGEPFLTGYGLLPRIEREADRLAYDYLMGFADGRHDRLAIAERAGLAICDLDEAVAAMAAAGLLTVGACAQEAP